MLQKGTPLPHQITKTQTSKRVVDKRSSISDLVFVST